MDTPVASLPLTFTAPMPGFEELHDFTLRSVEGATGLYALEAGSTPVRLFLADAAVFAPSYAPPVPAASLDALGLDEREAPQVLIVLNHAPGSTTVNLMAPIVLNRFTGRCTQLVLDGRDYPLRAELHSL
ncbi:flagellar assembly factor FliW [Arthrobacter oryzae]|uniref:Flagellar assembly factor FliW n=2 Tax=Arthrobacter oryzae TaxID=409290 RepID=A0A495EA16_9MICC|nr:flagellar assembly factor FliW [Arthrobacter oryzae]